MNDLRGGLKTWCNRMQIKGTEQFKMCEHAFCQDLLDAISLAYDLQHMLKMELPEEICSKRKKLLDSYQTGPEGFFYEYSAKDVLKESPIERALEMHGNYLTFQTIGAYRAIGKLPGKKITFYDLYCSDIEKYLEINCPWERSPWGAGGMLDNLGTILKCNIDMGNSGYKGAVEEIFAWLAKNQDEETGLWKSRNNSQGINGLVNGGYHLMRGTYFLYGRCFDKAERIIDTIVEDLKTDVVFHDDKAHGCNDLDHFFLLQKCHEMAPSHRKNEIIDIAAHRKNIILTKLLCADGGFSFWADSSVKVHNYLEVAPGYKEGDMQGTVFYLQTLLSINKILGEEMEYNDSMTHG